MTMQEEIKSVRRTVNWFVGIAITLLVILIGGAVRAEVKAADNAKMITKINNDYTPLFVLEGIVGSNDQLINILNTLPATTKDDPRYLDAIKERAEFQREILTRAAGAKRGSSSSSNSAQ